MYWRRLKWAGRLGLLLLAAAGAHLWGQAPPGGQAVARRPNFLISRPVPDPAAVERGQKVFVASCGFCHGSRATGGENGPDLVRSVVALRDEGGELLGPVIRKGSPDKGMPPFPLTDQQVSDIAAFLRSRQQAAINRSAYQIHNVVTGDAAKGQAYFNGMGKCSTCHSPGGDLRGVGSKYEPVAFQARFLYPETRGFGRRAAEGPRPKSMPVTVTLPSGQKISGGLEFLDDFNVSLRDASGVYHSWTRRDGLRVDVRDPLAGHQELLPKYTDADMHNVLAYLVTLK